MVKKAQFTLEFVLIFVFAFFVFLLLLAVVSKQIRTTRELAEQKELKSFAESIKKDIMLAHASSSEFEAKLNIPGNIDGVQIEILTDDQADLFIVRNLQTEARVDMYLPDIEGSLQIGCNRIYKNAGSIHIEAC